jgi:hypothetical protein
MTMLADEAARRTPRMGGGQMLNRSPIEKTAVEVGATVEGGIRSAEPNRQGEMKRSEESLSGPHENRASRT